MRGNESIGHGVTSRKGNRSTWCVFRAGEAARAGDAYRVVQGHRRAVRAALLQVQRLVL